MTDEEKKNIQTLKGRIENKEPLICYEFDLPLRLSKDEAGGLVIDCPCMHLMGQTEAGIVRVRLTPFAAHKLKEALDEIENTKDEQTLKVSSPTFH